MKFLLVFIVVFSSILFAKEGENKEVKKVVIKKDTNATKESNTTKVKTQTQKQIEIEMQKEKKYAKEQKFYRADEYDFKGSEVNMESVKKLKELENLDDFDMDSVYD